jgi:calcineurin-like phosphoesterase family protein
MTNSWLIADLHLNHAKILEFEPCRGTFDSIRDHDAAIIDKLNEYVKPNDSLMILGDLYFGKPDDYFKDCMRKLPGIKKLVWGNHDQFDPREYLYEFTWVGAYLIKYHMVFSHVPLHPDSVTRWGKNVHGHLHSHKVMKVVDGFRVPDLRYHCVSVETKAPEIGRPWHIDEVRSAME